jgi:alpha/beta superfamily hydrolase
MNGQGPDSTGFEDRHIVEERISFRSGGLRLAGILSYPASGIPRRGALLCPPHPHFAGDMDNNVIRALGRKLAADSAVLRFNYRGVGASEIDLPADLSVFDYWTEVEETRSYGDPRADVRAAARELAGLAGELPLALVGYSFGAIVALEEGLEHAGTSWIVGIAPPLTRFEFTFLVDCPVPCLLVSGEQDFVYSAAELERALAVAGPRLRTLVMPGQDHFFRGHEADLCRRVAGFLNDFARAENGGITNAP